MLGLARQLVEIHRDKTQPPFRCRSCGGENFRLWEDTPYGHYLTILGYDVEKGHFDLEYWNGESGDGGGDYYTEYWCTDCDDCAPTLEELVGMPQPEWAKPIFSWTGWDNECEPPEPNKEWLTILREGEEWATIVLRTDWEGDLNEARQEREIRAQTIVDALNRG